jgi:hypothetical protein
MVSLKCMRNSVRIEWDDAWLSSFTAGRRIHAGVTLPDHLKILKSVRVRSGLLRKRRGEYFLGRISVGGAADAFSAPELKC